MKYTRPSLCKNFSENDYYKSPDDSPNDYPILGPGGPDVIFDQPQLNSFPKPSQDGESYNRGLEGSNSNWGLNNPNFLTCFPLERSLGLC